MTSQPTHEFHSSEQQAEVNSNRVEILGAEFFRALSLRDTFNGSEDAFLTQKEIYDGMPHELSEPEVRSLRLAVGGLALDPNRGAASSDRAQLRLLHWLHRTSIFHGDEVTAESTKLELATFPFVKRAFIRMKKRTK